MQLLHRQLWVGSLKDVQRREAGPHERHAVLGCVALRKPARRGVCVGGWVGGSGLRQALRSGAGAQGVYTHLPTVLAMPRSMQAPQRSKPMASGQS